MIAEAYRHEAALLVIHHGVRAVMALVDVAGDDWQARVWDPAGVSGVGECAMDHNHSVHGDQNVEAHPAEAHIGVPRKDFACMHWNQ